MVGQFLFALLVTFLGTIGFGMLMFLIFESFDHIKRRSRRLRFIIN